MAARRRTVGAVIALAVAALWAAAPAGAEVDDDIAVEGTLQHVITDSEGAADADVMMSSAVEVDGALYALPDGAAPEATSGTEVQLDLDTDGLEPAEALADLNAEAPQVEVTEVTVLASGDQLTAEGQLGAHTVTVLPVRWSSAVGASVESLRSAAQTGAAYWTEQSGGRIAMSSVDVREYRDVPAPRSCSDSELLTLYNEALKAHGNVAAPGEQHHVVVYFPSWSACGWAGRATVGGGGMMWINGAAIPDVFAHELGHNFGLGHANTMTCTSAGQRVPLTVPWSTCTATEYGDYADVMGIAMNATTGSLNTALADSLGLAVVQQVSDGTVPLTVSLEPLASVNALRSIRIPVPGGDLFIDYRPATGRDQRVATWAGVQVHLRVTDQYGTPMTYLLDMTPSTSAAFAAPALAVSSPWSVPSTSTTVTVLGTGQTAQLQVGAPTGPSTPSTPATPSDTPSTSSEPPSTSSDLGAMLVDSPALTRDGRFYLRGTYSDGGADYTFAFGNPGDAVVMGDWDGNGTRTAGVFRGGTWYLRNSNTSGNGDIVIQFGSSGDVPVVGDWDGDGVDTVGVFRDGMWYVRNSNTSGPGERSYRYGQAGDTPVVGDWNNDDVDSPGIFRQGWWYLTNRPETGIAEGVFQFGSPGDRPVVGDWNRDGTDTLAVFRNGMWYLTNYFDRGSAEGWFRFGSAGDTPATFR